MPDEPEVSSGVQTLSTRMTIDIHPSRTADIRMGVRERLNSMLMRYRDVLGGVLLEYHNVVIHGKKGHIMTSLNPCVHVEISADFLIFRPQVGTILEGTVNNVAADFIGLLTREVFNVSIPQMQMPGYEYQHPEEDAFDEESLLPSWRSNNSKRQRIGVGSRVAFQVARVHNDGEFLSVQGALGPAGTGLVVVQKKKKADKQKADGAGKRMSVGGHPVRNGGGKAGKGAIGKVSLATASGHLTKEEVAMAKAQRPEPQASRQKLSDDGGADTAAAAAAATPSVTPKKKRKKANESTSPKSQHEAPSSQKNKKKKATAL